MPPAKRCRGMQKEVRDVHFDGEIWDKILEIEVQVVALPATTNELTDALEQLGKLFSHFPPLQGRASGKQKYIAQVRLEHVAEDAARRREDTTVGRRTRRNAEPRRARFRL